MQFKSSFLQRKIFNLCRSHKKINVNQPLLIDLGRGIDKDKLQTVVNTIIKRHEALRTFFKIGNQQIIQCIQEDLIIEINDRSHQQISPLVLRELQSTEQFDLENLPLLKIYLFKDEDNYILVINKHLIISDLYSDEVLKSEFQLLFKNKVLPETFQYVDYSIWQNELLTTSKGEVTKSLWVNWLKKQAPNPVRFKKVSTSGKPLYHLQSFAVQRSIQKKIDNCCTVHRISRETFFLSIYYIVLNKFLDTANFAIVCRFCGRNDPSLMNCIGFLENDFPIFFSFGQDRKVADVFMQVKERVNMAKNDGWFPFDVALDTLSKSSKNQNFDDLFNLQFRYIDFLNGKHTLIKKHLYDTLFTHRPNADISIVFLEGEDLKCLLKYNSELLQKGFIERFADYFITACKSILENPDKTLANMQVISDTERNKLLYEFNNARFDFKINLPIHNLFELQVQKTPYAKAVIYNDYSLNYQELNSRSNQIAHLLTTNGIDKGDRVGIYLERDITLAVALLAVLKSGGVYIPLDVQNPLARIRKMIENADCTSVLISKNLLYNHREVFTGLMKMKLIICVDDIGDDYQYIEQEIKIPIFSSTDYEKQSTHNTEISVNTNDLAYIIYTSGSTGSPKGVMIRHSGAINHIYGKFKELSLPERFNFLQSASIASDISVWQFLAPWLKGGASVIISKTDFLEYEKFFKTVEDKNVEIVEVVPSYLNGLLEYLNKCQTALSPLSNLKWLMVTGEEVLPKLVNEWFGFYSNIKIINAYGPAEASDDITQYIIEGPLSKGILKVPIGKPLPNLNIFILSDRMELLPLGALGEICVSGAGVGDGYLNDIEKTDQNFVKNPFKNTLGNVIYKTGDLGRWLDDGNLEFLGRKVHQLKIRGYRVEVGEIEFVLKQYQKVKDAVVEYKNINKGQQALVGYIIPSQKESLYNHESLTEEIRTYLQRYLPDHMRPSEYVLINSFPLNFSGKVDRGKLPAPQKQVSLSSGFIGTPVKKKIAEIWSGLLGFEVKDDKAIFFEIGGDSLMAIKLMSRLQEEFHKAISLYEIFEHASIEAQAQLIKSLSLKDFETIPKIEKQALYDLSRSQKRLWVEYQINKNESLYNLFYAFYLYDLNTEMFEMTLQSLISRHEILRTVFILEGDIPKQKIIDEQTFNFKIDYINESIKNIETYISQQIEQPFNLTDGPLLRVLLIKTGKNKHLFLMVIHHIISDGWSQTVMSRDIIKLYNAYLSGKRKALNPLRIQYKDYVAWQNMLMSPENISPHRKYWLKQLEGDLPILNLLTDFPRPSLMTHNGKSLESEIEEFYTKKIERFCHQEKVTKYVFLMALIKTLLFKYTGQEDIVIGSPLVGRDHPELDDQIGFYINILPFRTRFKAHSSFKEFLHKVHEVVLEGFRHQHYPIDSLVEELQAGKDISRSPLFDIGITWHPEEYINALSLNEAHSIKAEPFEAEVNRSHRDIWFHGSKENGKINLRIEYNTDLYKKSRIQRLKDHLQILLEAILQDPNRQLSDLPYLSPREITNLLEISVDTAPYPSTETIHSLFEKSVKKFPIKTAVSCDGLKLSYHELNEAGNQIAYYLKEMMALGSGDIVGIMLEKSVQLVKVMLGVLKAGAAYFPLDPSYPAERLSTMIEDAHIKALITESNYLLNIGGVYSGDLMVVDVMTDYLSYPKENVTNINTSRDLAYIMFTSGSMGRPKGVLIEHQSVIRLLKSTNYVKLNSDDRLLQTGALSFDATTFEIWSMLLNGGELHFIPQSALMDIEQFKRKIANDKISLLWLTSPWFNQLVDTDISLFKPLKQLIVGGDKLSVNHINKVSKDFPHIQIINGYGPTENTTFSICHRIENICERDVPLGRPISNSKVFILDSYRNLVPKGISGEIYVGGPGLARGYLNQPELTAGKFIMDPFNSDELLYKTGDLGFWNEDDLVQFLGRDDNQIKVRGFRIELDEIKWKLEQFEGVKEALVVFSKKEDPLNRLMAYYTSTDRLPTDELNVYLRKHLPDYMIPYNYIHLSKFPLTANGKVDKKALPGADSQLKTRAFIGPRNEVERKLIECWKEVLEKEAIDVKDDFFMAGGDSIKAIRIISLINKNFKKNLDIKDIFNYPILENLAELLKTKSTNTWVDDLKKARAQILSLRNDFLSDSSVANILPSDWEDFYPMGRIQQGMIYHNVLLANEGIYIDQFLHFVNNELSYNTIHKAFLILVKRHPILRTSFNFSDFPIPIQIIHKPNNKVLPNFTFTDLSHTNEDGQKEYLTQLLERCRKQGFNINQPGLWKLYIIKLGTDSTALFWTFHHSIIDGWSNASLMKEFKSLYDSMEREEPFQLAPIKSSYKDYIVHQQAIVNNDKVKSFWRNLLVGYERTPLPLNKNANLKDNINIHSFNIKSDVYEILVKRASEFNVTLKEICLAAFLYLIRITTNVRDIVIGIVTHGRPETEDSDKIVGCFLNTVPLRISVNSKTEIRKLVQQVKDQSYELKGFDKLPLFEILKIVQPNSDFQNPIFDLLFNFVNLSEHKTTLDLGDWSTDKKSGFVSELNGSQFTNELFGFDVGINTNSLQISINYASSYSQSEILRLANIYREIVSVFCSEQSIIYPRLVENDQSFVKHKFVPDAVSKDLTFQHAFSKQVNLAPDKIAFLCNDHQFTFTFLDEMSDRVAVQLMKVYHLKRGSLVALWFKKSPEMIIALIAVIKTGAIYIPLDDEIPNYKVINILKHSSVQFLITNLRKTLPGFEGISISITELIDRACSYDRIPVNIQNVPSDILYILYTSGTTGNPKAVAVEHRNVMSILQSWHDAYGLQKLDIHLLQLANFSFDVFMGDLCKSILQGGRIVLCSKDTKMSFEKMYEIMEKQGVTIFESTPGFIVPFIDYIYNSGRKLSKIQSLIFGSDICHWQDFISVCDRVGENVKVINSYGTTEAAIDSTYFDKTMCLATPTNGSTPIGVPFSNTRIYVLDDELQEVIDGVTGELFIGGYGVSRGYYLNDQLTREKFISHPNFSNEKLYKSGDLVRWLSDGNLEFVGRSDTQIKVRGFRVDVTEIEDILLLHENVSEAAASLKDAPRGPLLIAYYKGDKDVSSELPESLKAKLPFYMVPNLFVKIDELPLNANGKIDRKALPIPQELIDQAEERKELVKPSTELETLVVDIWKKILATDVGITSNFFDLGGDSIKAIQMSSSLYAQGYNLNIADVFVNPTIKELVNCLTIQDKVADQSLIIGEASLTPIQMEHFSQLADYRHFDSHTLMLFCGDGFNVGYLQIIGKKLLEHHDVLRVTFVITPNHIVQLFNDLIFTTPLKVYNLKKRTNYLLAIEEIAKKVQSSFQLSQGPLFKMVLFQCPDGDRLFIVAHHLVIDGVSWRILLEDIQNLYLQLSRNEKPKLPLKTHSFKLWTERLQEYATSEIFIKEIPYWIGIENHSIPSTTSQSIQNNLIKEIKTILFVLSSDETDTLLYKSNHAYNTEINELLLASISIAFANVFNLTSVVIALEGHGREQFIDGLNINRTVGWFTSIFPLILKNNKNDELPLLIKNTKETIRRIPNNGIGYGIYKYLTPVELKQGYNKNFKPEIGFNYLGQFNESLEMNDNFKIDSNPTGNRLHPEAIADYLLEFTGMVRNGRFEMSIAYNKQCYTKQIIEDLKLANQDALRLIIKHCSGIGISEITPSDLTYKDLTIEELESFFD